MNTEVSEFSEIPGVPKVSLLHNYLQDLFKYQYTFNVSEWMKEAYLVLQTDPFKSSVQHTDIGKKVTKDQIQYIFFTHA